MELTLYTRAGCHLCDEMKAELEPLLGEFSVELREVDVDTDAMLAGRFGEEVPVLLLDGRKVAKHRLDIKQLRRRLQEGTTHRGGAEDAEGTQRTR